MRSSRMLSTPARCIQPAEPVYQVQPPRHLALRRVNIGRDDVGLHLVEMHVGAGARMLDGVQKREQLGGLIAFAKPDAGN